MTPKTFIEKIIKGGWKHNAIQFLNYPKDSAIFYSLLRIALLDPKAFEALGKVEGWGRKKEDRVCLHENPEASDNGICESCFKKACQKKMHQMIDALCEGRTIEQYLKTL